MPRKSTGSESTQDSSRSSLQRFASFASLQSLNPFARRRSNNATDNVVTTTFTSSNTSLTTSGLPSVQSSFERFPAPATTFDTDPGPPQQPPPQPPQPPQPPASLRKGRWTPRKSSYVCIPDDPIGGMPRSRTFSNLPVPVRRKRNGALDHPIAPPRLPCKLPTSRIPSPLTSTRKHSTDGVPQSTLKVPLANMKLRRSDTEPLLVASVQNASSITLPRSTAFKENIQLSPIKLWPDGEDGESEWDLYGSSPSLARRNLSFGQIDVPLQCGFDTPTAALPVSRYSKTYSGTPVYQSSPGYHCATETFSSPPSNIVSRPQPAQRWNSQPVLTHTTNIRARSFHNQIQQRRLLSERQPPTPPLPPTPMTSNSSLARARASSRPTVSTPPKATAQEINQPEASEYWLGRVAALCDRYRNEELSQLLCPNSRSTLSTNPFDNETMHTPEAATSRERRALEQLYRNCINDTARQSLRTFQLQFAAIKNSSELAKPLGSAGMRDRGLIRLGAEGHKAAAGNVKHSMASKNTGSGAGSARRMAFIDRLLGKGGRETKGTWV